MTIAILDQAECQSKLNEDFIDSLLQFLQQNKMKYVAFASLDTEYDYVKEQYKRLARTSKLLSNIRSRVLQPKHLHSKYRFHQDYLVLVTSPSSENWQKYIEIISNTKVMHCIVVCIGKLQKQRMNMVAESLHNKLKNAFFYWVGVDSGKIDIMTWNQIISVKNSKKTIISPIKFDPFGRILIERNLHGFHINCSTLDWRPWFKFTNCKGVDNTNCSGVGFLADVMNILGARFNFTWSCDREPEDNWGNTKPIAGPRNANGSWGGVIGYVANGTYPLSISAWRLFYWRKDLLDFVGIGSASKHVVAFIPSGSTYDPGL